MSFSARRKRIYAAHHLGQFAERTVFRPVAGDARPIWFSISPEQRAESTEHTQDEMERLVVFGLRDQTHEKGGVSELKLGDSIQRFPNRDPDQRPIVYDGELIEWDEHTFTAIFLRDRRTVQGRGHRR